MSTSSLDNDLGFNACAETLVLRATTELPRGPVRQKGDIRYLLEFMVKIHAPILLPALLFVASQAWFLLSIADSLQTAIGNA